MVTKAPNTTWKPLGTQTEPRISAHDIICYHTMVGYLTSTYSMFRNNGYGGTESHFGVGGVWGGDKDQGLDGDVWQFQDLDYTADANLEGNYHVISIETADSAPNSSNNLPAWTDNQLDALVSLTVWLCQKYDIPATLIPDTKPGRRGLAYHAQGVEHSDGVGSHPGWLVSGGERWSTSRGKVCPGDARIRQIKAVIIPRVQALLNGEDQLIVTPDDEAKVRSIVHSEVYTALQDRTVGTNLARNIVNADVVAAPDYQKAANPTWQMNSYFSGILARAMNAETGVSQLQDSHADIVSAIAEFKNSVAAIQGAVANLQTAVNALPKAPNPPAA